MAEVIIGMQEFQNRLKELDRVMREQALIQMAKAGAEIVLHASRSMAPQGESGRLVRGIQMVQRRASSDIYEATVDVGPDKKTFYGIFQERGTVHHDSQPFMGPALESNRGQMYEAMKAQGLKAIAKFQGKLVKAGRR